VGDDRMRVDGGRDEGDAKRKEEPGNFRSAVTKLEVRSGVE
jgi:hypothetical protein